MVGGGGWNLKKIIMTLIWMIPVWLQMVTILRLNLYNLYLKCVVQRGDKNPFRNLPLPTACRRAFSVGSHTYAVLSLSQYILVFQWIFPYLIFLQFDRIEIKESPKLRIIIIHSLYGIFVHFVSKLCLQMC